MATTLTAAEREKFALWLEEDAFSNEGLAAQIDTLGPAHKPMASKYRVEAAAAKIIAAKLRSIETVEIIGA